MEGIVVGEDEEATGSGRACLGGVDGSTEDFSDSEAL